MGDLRCRVIAKHVEENLQDGLIAWLDFRWVFTPNEFRERNDCMRSNVGFFVAETLNKAVSENIVRVLTEGEIRRGHFGNRIMARTLFPRGRLSSQPQWRLNGIW